MADFCDRRIVLQGSFLLVKTSVLLSGWLVLTLRMFPKSFVLNFGMLLASVDGLGYIVNISVRRIKYAKLNLDVTLVSQMGRG